jgi:hypothetical protein
LCILKAALSQSLTSKAGFFISMGSSSRTTETAINVAAMGRAKNTAKLPPEMAQILFEHGAERRQARP